MENYESAEIDYLNGMKYKDIADKYETTINTVKSWKKRYGWERKKGAHKNEKRVHTKNGCKEHQKEPEYDGTKETLENDELSPEQQMFCVFYIRTFNATQSYLKAYGCSYEVANAKGPLLVVKDSIRKELERLKEIKRRQIVAGADDFVELQMRIAFADIGNYVSFGRENVQVMGPFGPIKDSETGEFITREVNAIHLNESGNVDTQIIQEVKQGRDGVSVKLADRQKAIDWLTMFFELNPDNKHRKEFDKRKLELDLMKLEMQTKESADENQTKDNFLDVLNETAKDVWSDG